MGKECGAWVSRRLWGGGNTSPLKTTAWEAKSGAPNDSFLSDPLKRYFRLSGVPLKLCKFILGHAIIFLSVRSF